MCMSSVGRLFVPFAVYVLCAGRALAAGESAAERLARGKTVIEENCGDAYPASREVLEAGIADVTAAVQQGLDTAEAHRLLACAYATLGSRYASYGSERVQLARKELDALRRAAARDARDVPSRMRIAAVTEDRQEELDAYESVLRIDPNHAVALYASGKLLLRRNEAEKGLKRLERAGELANDRDAEAWGDDVVRTLREHGRGARADELKTKLDAKAAARRGERGGESHH